MHTYNEIGDSSEETSLCNKINFLNCHFINSNNLFTLNNIDINIINCM